MGTPLSSVSKPKDGLLDFFGDFMEETVAYVDLPVTDVELLVTMELLTERLVTLIDPVPGFDTYGDGEDSDTSYKDEDEEGTCCYETSNGRRRKRKKRCFYICSTFFMVMLVIVWYMFLLSRRGQKVLTDAEKSSIMCCIARNVKRDVRQELLDDESIESFIEVENTILCSNIKCVTYHQEYSFASVHITKAPKGDWFCPSCSQLPPAGICVEQQPVVDGEVAVVTKVRREAAIASDAKRRVALEQHVASDSDDDDEQDICRQPFPVVAETAGNLEKRPPQLSKSSKRRK